MNAAGQGASLLGTSGFERLTFTARTAARGVVDWTYYGLEDTKGDESNLFEQ